MVMRCNVLFLALGMTLCTLPGGTSRADSAPAPASASTLSIMRPRAIVIHVHREVADQRFLPDLTRRLAANLAPPVHVLRTDFDLAPLRPALGAIDGEAAAGALIGSVDWVRHAATVQVLIIPDELRLRPARFNFAVSNGTAVSPHHIVIVSLARLQKTRWADRSADSNPARTAERVFKLILKNVARVSGYAGSSLCIFGFPRNVEELDALPEGFCEPDRARLVAAGLAKP